MSDSASESPPIPWLGLGAVLMGTFISTVTSRLSSFGLADIRGAVHASFDQGAWITTAQSVGQMLMAPAAIWVRGVEVGGAEAEGACGSRLRRGARRPPGTDGGGHRLCGGEPDPALRTEY